MPVLEIPTTITLDTLNERDDDLIEVVELPSSTEGHRVRTPRPKSDTYDAFVLDNEDLAEKSIMPFRESCIEGMHSISRVFSRIKRIVVCYFSLI